MVLWPHAMPYSRKPALLCRVWEMWHCRQPAHSVSQHWGMGERSVLFVTRVDLSFPKCFSMQQGCSHNYCSILYSDSWGGSCPSSQGSHFTIHSRPGSGKSPRGDPILFPLSVVAQWPVSEALSGRRLGAPLPPGLAEKAEWLFNSASRATRSGPAKSNILACLCSSQHTEHWGYQIRRVPPLAPGYPSTLTGRLGLSGNTAHVHRRCIWRASSWTFS